MTAFEEGVEAYKSQAVRHATPTRVRLLSGAHGLVADDIQFHKGYYSELRRHWLDHDEADENHDAG